MSAVSQVYTQHTLSYSNVSKAAEEYYTDPLSRESEQVVYKAFQSLPSNRHHGGPGLHFIPSRSLNHTSPVAHPALLLGNRSGYLLFVPKSVCLGIYILPLISSHCLPLYHRIRHLLIKQGLEGIVRPYGRPEDLSTGYFTSFSFEPLLIKRRRR